MSMKTEARKADMDMTSIIEGGLATEDIVLLLSDLRDKAYRAGLKREDVPNIDSYTLTLLGHVAAPETIKIGMGHTGPWPVSYGQGIIGEQDKTDRGQNKQKAPETDWHEYYKGIITQINEDHKKEIAELRAKSETVFTQTGGHMCNLLIELAYTEDVDIRELFMCAKEQGIYEI